jgi:hypothetical protein
MINFRDYKRVRLCTHGRTESATGHSVGHFDDLICRVAAGKFAWDSERLDDLSEASVSAWLSNDPGTLNIICDFIYVPDPKFPNLLIFDHHDPNNPIDKCSAHQLMEELVRQGMLREVPSLMDQISSWDVIGPNAVPVADRPDPDRYTAILAAEPNEGFDRKTAEFILMMLDRSFSIRQFVNELFESETRFGENARRIHSEILAKREEALAKITSGALVQVSPSGVRYATIAQNPAGVLNELFSRLRVDVLIHPNERTPNAVSVVRDSNGRYATTPVSELVEVAPEQVVFVHPGGFLLVAHPPLEIK